MSNFMVFLLFFSYWFSPVHRWQKMQLSNQHTSNSAIETPIMSLICSFQLFWVAASPPFWPLFCWPIPGRTFSLSSSRSSFWSSSSAFSSALRSCQLSWASSVRPSCPGPLLRWMQMSPENQKNKTWILAQYRNLKLLKLNRAKIICEAQNVLHKTKWK